MRRGCVLVGSILLSSSTAWAEECRLHVDAGALSGRMIALLAKEVPGCEVVTSSQAATLSLAIMRTDGHLDVDMTAPPATPVLARRVAVDEGDPEPALRRIALLAARAVESSSHLEPFEMSATVEEQSEGEPLHLSAGLSFATQWWRSPGGLQFGPALTATIEVGDFDFGLYGAWLIRDERRHDFLETTTTEVSVLARGAWRPLALGPVSFGLDLGAGINAIWLEAVPDKVSVVPGEVGPTKKDAREGLIRAGAVIDAWLVGERLHVFVRGGGLIRIGEVQLPVPADYADEPIRSGLLTGWAELGLAVRFF